MKYKTPKLVTGGIGFTRSTYIAITGQVIEIVRERSNTKSYVDNTPNKAKVTDIHGNFVFIPRKINRSPGAIGKYLFEQSKA